MPGDPRGAAAVEVAGAEAAVGAACDVVGVAVATVVVVAPGAVVVVLAEEAATRTTRHVPPKLITPSPVASEGELSLT